MTNVSFVPQLDSENLPEMEITNFTPKVLDVFDSILLKNIVELEKMNIDDLRSIFISEIKSLQDLNINDRDTKLQKIFSLLLQIEPAQSLNFRAKSKFDFSLHEHRLYWDLITTPGLFDIDYVTDFLKNKFLVGHSDEDKRKFLCLSLEYYTTHSKDACDKFNYVIRSNDQLSSDFIKKNIDLNYFFSERVTSLFSKEELAQLFAFYFNRYGWIESPLQDYFSPSHQKTLFMISVMNKKVKSITGHSSEFLESSFSLFYDLIELLSDAYDKFVGDSKNEEAFSLTCLKMDNIPGITELINNICSYSYDQNSFHDLISVNFFDQFMEMFKNRLIENNNKILYPSFLDKINNNSFNSTIDLKSIISEEELESFKDALLYNIYGISFNYAEHLKMQYGQYIDVLEKDIIEKDIPILELLKSIISIVDLDQPNFKEKINILRMSYLKEMENKESSFKNNINSSIVIEGLFNKMYMNTYNKVLNSNFNKFKFIENDDGVPLLDAGFDFSFIVSALGGGSDDNFFDVDVNIASKWNTSGLLNFQGLCTSFINNENMGVISLKYPLLAFENIPNYSLNMMGANDIFSIVDRYNLRKSNSSEHGRNRCFIPASILANETRYGYNEILLDRYLIDDEKGNLKLQPSYVIFYKLEYDGNYKDTECYKNTLKTAKDFGIPIIIIDVVKLKENELKIIKEKEEELFSSKVSKPDLLNEIITRYMNNYTGDLTIEGEQSDLGCLSYSSFVKKEIKNFIEKLLIFTATIDDISLRSKWIYDLNSIYLEEKRKYDKASSIRGWNCSVNSFLFEDEDLDTIIKLSVEPEFDEFFHIYKNDNNHKNEYEVDYNNYPLVELQNNISAAFMTKKSFIPIIQTIVNLVNYLDMGTCLRIGDYNYNGVLGNLFYSISISDSDVFLIEDLVCSYFLGNCDVRNLECLACLNLGKLNKKINIDENYDWNNDVMNSVYSNLIINSETTEYNPNIVNQFIEKIESTSDEKILEIFSPIIQAQAENTTDSVNDICLRILKKKAEFRNSFEKLNAQVAFLKNDDVINYSSDNYGNSSKK